MSFKFWVGGAGNWSDPNHWSLTSGGASGVSVPTISDDVIIDLSGYEYTEGGDVIAYSIELDETAYTKTFSNDFNIPINNNGFSILQAGDSLYKRLYTESPDGKLAVHGFYSAMVDFAMGNATQLQLETFFNLHESAKSDLNYIKETYLVQANKNIWLHWLHSMMMLAELGYKYNTESSFNEALGIISYGV